MAKAKKSTLAVRGTAISILTGQDGDFISLTDMLRAKDGDFFISDWLRNRNTFEFLGIWESVLNPAFNYGEFAIIKSQAGLHSYKISVKEWVEKTHAIGLKATAGRYGGTFAQGLPPAERLLRLNEIAIVQMRSLLSSPAVKRLK